MFNKRSGIFGGVAALAGLIVLVASVSMASGSIAGAQGRSSAPTPEDFDRYLVYMANGIFDPTEEPAFQDGDIFQKEIMGRSDAEVAEQEALAREFFEGRFGLNLDDGTVTIESFTFNPVHNYRAYTISDEFVPAEGWGVRDGGFMATVVAEDGVTLGGEFDGVHAPEGTFFVFGDYNILDPGPGNSGREREIVLHYRSGNPLMSDEFGVMHFVCGLVESETDLGLTEADWAGMAQGVVRPPEPQGDGNVKVSMRNVLTFPPR